MRLPNLRASKLKLSHSEYITVTYIPRKEKDTREFPRMQCNVLQRPRFG